MEDIAPQILKQIEGDFQKEFKENKKIRTLYKKIEEGKATYREANGFAIETGKRYQLLSKRIYPHLFFRTESYIITLRIGLSVP